MYSVNDWRNYTLAHAIASKVGQSASAQSSPSSRVAKWDWSGGNNSKAYNEWYYSHNKDKWRQYYLNKKKKQGNPKALRAVKDYLAINKIDDDFNRNSVVRRTGALVKGTDLATRMSLNPERIENARMVDGDYVRGKLNPYGHSSYAYQDAADYDYNPNPQTPSRGASRRRQTR